MDFDPGFDGDVELKIWIVISVFDLDLGLQSDSILDSCSDSDLHVDLDLEDTTCALRS